MNPYQDPDDDTVVDDRPQNDDPYQLIVFNDDVNSFDHVIRSFVDILKHTTQQAEQCATLIHYKGKCAVKNGDFVDLLPFQSALSDRGLSVDIQ